MRNDKLHYGKKENKIMVILGSCPHHFTVLSYTLKIGSCL